MSSEIKCLDLNKVY